MANNIIRKLYTLVFVRDLPNKKILLGYKKRGFGMNKWNGLGGKVEKGERIVDGAIREAREESGLEIWSAKQCGYLEFQFESKMNSEMMEVHIFTVDEYKGSIRECDEILPQWWDMDKIPYDKMWQDDRFWYQYMIENKLFKGYFLFKDDEDTIISQKLDLVEKLFD